MTIEFGNLVKELLQQSELKTQNALAKHLGTDQGSLSRIIRGHLNPNPALAVNMMHALRVDPKDRVNFLMKAQGYQEYAVRLAIEGLTQDNDSHPRG